VIDAQALRHNLSVVRQLAPASRVMAVVKANAYGHGLVPTAKALAAADAFGVARIEEALVLRAAGITNSIVLLEGVFCAEQLSAAIQHRLDIVVHSFEQIALLESHSGRARLPVWLKVDTGMNRLGFRLTDFAAAWARIHACRHVEVVRLMTHLAASEDRSDPRTPTQLASFRSVSENLAVERSIANSAGLIGWPDSRAEWVRPGLMLYGISPLPNQEASSLGLRPAMTLTTQLIATRRVLADESVGYNGIWRAARDSNIGIVAIGYGDGYPRNMRVGAPVLVDGRAASVVGRVSMDMTAVDITELPEASVGSSVTLWGQGVPAERVAPYADAIAYELVCGVSERVALEWKTS
jgi:alanine racemase